MAEDISSLLLQTLISSGAGPDIGSIIQGVLSQIGDADPRMQLFAKFLTQRQAGESEDEVSADGDADSWSSQSDSDLERTSFRSAERRRAPRRLQEQIKTMRIELQELRERNDVL